MRASRGPAQGHPQHTALLGEWAIGKTTLLMHWRRLPGRQAGDAVVLVDGLPAVQGRVPRSAGSGDRGRARSGAGRRSSTWRSGSTSALPRPVSDGRPFRPRKSCAARSGAAPHRGDGHTLVVVVDDVDLVADPRRRPPAAAGDRPRAVCARDRDWRSWSPPRRVCSARCAAPTSRSCASSSPSRSGPSTRRRPPRRSPSPLADTHVTFDGRGRDRDRRAIRRTPVLPTEARLLRVRRRRRRSGRTGGVRRRLRAGLRLGEPRDLRCPLGGDVARRPRRSSRSSSASAEAATVRRHRGAGRHDAGSGPARPDSRCGDSRPEATSIGWRTGTAAGTRSAIGSSGASWSCRRESRRSVAGARARPLSTVRRGRGVSGCPPGGRPKSTDHRVVSGLPP